MFCPYCGAPLDDDDKACPACGREVSWLSGAPIADGVAGEDASRAAGRSAEDPSAPSSDADATQLLSSDALEPDDAEVDREPSPEANATDAADSTQAIDPMRAAGSSSSAAGQDAASTFSGNVVPPRPVTPRHWAEDSDDLSLRGAVNSGYRPTGERASKAPSTSMLVGVCVVMVTGCLGFIIFLTNGFGLLSATGSVTPISVQAPVTTANAAMEDAADTTSASTSDDSVKANLAAYSWADLSAIAAKVEAAGSREDALKVAETYNLVSADGTISSNVTTLQLTDGTKVSVRLADVYHDDLSDGSGKAGLTFVCTTSAGTHRMQSTDTNTGGWEGSEMRSWLAGTELSALPSDLSQAIVSVKKSTENVGYSKDPSSVTTTDDKIWLLSYAELAGTPSWDWGGVGNASAYNAILGAEGTQYACFSGSSSNLVVKDASGTATIWWLRSTSPSNTKHYRSVSAGGSAASYDASNEEHGVVFGFCL
ncbi:MAG: DUF6273 domain-containing protein [Atopobiaceae bacterium]|jgi:hypothetical protein|nr:zinc ribbon domain-containing protein [Atopobiaceae bacterium]MCH4180402.1 zinc ribbon domain-containing protein [Atopobiaceae bacterium]MCH4214506.1 zinc ribbon domain-containing protein [Atopobiaceae bacterium]MCH4276280.1 zinc ribbon domain-containing protein [Atopobiaceae bacterium]MCI1226829.1 zinc ribbon domain-containing protein [Atopobiaceae bacterium]